MTPTIDGMTGDDRSGFDPEKIAAIATSMAQMIEARGGPDGEFARRMVEMMRSGAHGATDDERHFLELAARLSCSKRPACFPSRSVAKLKIFASNLDL